MVRIRGCHPLRPAFPDRSAPNQNATTWSYYPARASPHGRFGLFPGRSPLLGESLLFSLPGGTKMFQFPPLAPHANKRRCQASCLAGCPIRIPPGQRPCAPNRGFSQLVASFFAFVQPAEKADRHTFSCIALVDSVYSRRRNGSAFANRAAGCSLACSSCQRSS